MDAAVGRAGRDALDFPDGTSAGILRLPTPVALAPGRSLRAAARACEAPVGGVVLDVAPPRGISRRRQTAGPGRDARTRRFASATGRLDLHGAVSEGGRTVLAPDVRALPSPAPSPRSSDEASLASVRTAVADDRSAAP